MSLEVLSGNAPFVTLAEAKIYLRVDHDEENALIGDLIAFACEMISGNSSVTGKFFPATSLRKTFFLSLDEVGIVRGDSAVEFSLPGGKVGSLTKVQHKQQGGNVDLPLGKFVLKHGQTASRVFCQLVYFDELIRLSDTFFPQILFEYSVGSASVPYRAKKVALSLIGDAYLNRETNWRGQVRGQAVGYTAELTPLYFSG